MASNTEEETNPGKKLNYEGLSVRPRERLERKSHFIKEPDKRNLGTKPRKAKESTKIPQIDVLGIRSKEKPDKMSDSDIQGTSNTKPKFTKVKTFIANIVGFVKKKTSHSRRRSSDLPKTLESKILGSEHDITGLNQIPGSKHDQTWLSKRPAIEHNKTGPNQRSDSEHNKTLLNQRPELDYDKPGPKRIPESERDQTGLNQRTEIRHDEFGVKQRPGSEHDQTRLISKGENQCKKKQESFSHKAYYDMVDDDISPPDNFRYVSILPTIDDIKSKERPFLRPNIELGQYKDLDHYLDVQFRLLKEDFLHPLREGISTYRDMIATGDLKRKLYDIKIYDSVKVLYPVCAFNGINHIISFNVSKLNHINWINSKRLIHGSLLCLSNDNFKNVHFATVSNSTPDNLKMGKLEIQFTHHFAEGDLANYIMAESTAFFEAYRHVLKGLQKVGADLPFQKYLINCSREIDPPKYMLENKNINFNIPFPMERQIKLMDDNLWPTYRELKLDRPQYLALKAALRNELAIIQGPPGTGKTFIGLKIMQCLLMNECLWKSPIDKDSSPIIVVCLTNHALDQFLEGILKHMSDDQKLIRVGRRSKSEKLNSKILGEYKERMRKSRSIPKSYYNDRSKASDEKKDYERELGYAQWELKQSEDEFMNEVVLQRYISKEHLEALQGQYSDYIYNESGNFKQNVKFSILPTWLGFVGRDESLITNVSDDKGSSCTDTSDNESEDESIYTDGNVLTESDDVDDNDDDDTDEDDEATIKKNNHKLDMYDKACDTGRKLQRNIKQNKEVVEEIQWQYQEKERERKRDLKINIKNRGAMTNREVASLGNIWDLAMPNRWRLYRHWVRQYQELKRNIIIMYKALYERACGSHILALENEDRYVMGTAAVLGMTTTGAAKHRRVLAELRPKIVIVEEAAEVLEAQIITCLSSACEHLILIGDHKQLQPTVYELAERFKLKVSLFERMINNGIPCVTLETQHRMRPEISMFMKHIYPELKDSESVKGMENVKGISRNVFLINHSYVENHDEELTSKSKPCVGICFNRDKSMHCQ